MTTTFKDYLKKNSYTRFDLKAVLFDMDGVLYDSMKYHAESWKQTMDEYGLDSTEEEFYLYEGMVGSNTINTIMKRERKREATESEIKEIYARKTGLFSQMNKGELIPYALDFVNRVVHNDGLKSLVVTGSGQPTLIERLAKSFPQCFERKDMVTAFDVKHGKPHPEPYLMGLHKAGNINPNQAIVVENAPRGVEAAVAAGIFTIAINTGPLPEKILADAGANIVLPSMEALLNNWEQYKSELF